MSPATNIFASLNFINNQQNDSLPSPINDSNISIDDDDAENKTQ